jgi:hypothetical protein
MWTETQAQLGRSLQSGEPRSRWERQEPAAQTGSKMINERFVLSGGCDEGAGHEPRVLGVIRKQSAAEQEMMRLDIRE